MVHRSLGAVGLRSDHFEPTSDHDECIRPWVFLGHDGLTCMDENDLGCIGETIDGCIVELSEHRTRSQVARNVVARPFDASHSPGPPSILRPYGSSVHSGVPGE